MMKCLAPVLLIASTVAPRADQCPVFNGPKDLACESYGPQEQPLHLPLIPMTIGMGAVDGQRSYVIGSTRGTRTVVVGRPITQNGVTVATAECASVHGKRGDIPTMILRTLNGAGQVESENHFSQQEKAAVNLTYGPQGPNGGLRSKLVCRPVKTGPARR